MRSPRMKVGEVAKRTGLTVRTLHYYDAIGLLSPSEQTESGHRLYTPADVARLQQIVSLRQLGFSLSQIGQLLSEPGCSLVQVIELQLEAARAQLERTQKLCRQLEAMAARLRSGESPSLDELLQTIEVTTMYEKYFTPEQVSVLKARAQKLGPAALQKSEGEWKELSAEFKAEFDRGADPTSPTVQALARRWQALIDQITGGDAGIHQGLVAIYRNEPDLTARFLAPGVDRRVFEFIGKALDALNRG